MASTLTNVKIMNCTIDVTFDEEELTFRDNLFMAVAGLEAGSWSSVVTGCEVTGTLMVNATNKVSHGGEIYLGGILGENYATVSGCKTDVTPNLTYIDQGTESEDMELVINVGGLDTARVRASRAAR